ncbi:DUF4397 domain-containing protein [Sutcliffiella deserti]|uniref:DUF4397 domain-containing protein n=1 Tax=Sutcliffiella deserti TaxID=2875501 RepID=UPI001CBA79BD|nr:DUF4397 domain-containing protein [Sutcliffiella deserti]
MKKLLFMLSVCMLVLGVAGGAFASEGGAKVRILHASPDAPEVDVYVDGAPVVKAAAFKAATEYLPLKAGEHTVEIFPAGKKDQAVISQKVTVEQGKAYTVAAANKLANLELVIVEDSMDVTEGKTKIRVGHLSPDAPTVDVGLKGGEALFKGASFKGVTDYIEVAPGLYDLEIRTPDGKQVLDLSGSKLEGNNVYSLFAVNTADKLEVLALVDNAKTN